MVYLKKNGMFLNTGFQWCHSLSKYQSRVYAVYSYYIVIKVHPPRGHQGNDRLTALLIQ